MPTMTKPTRRAATWRIDEDLLSRLDEVSERIGVPRAEIVRLCLDVGLKELESAANSGKVSHSAMAQLQELVEKEE